MTRRLFLGLALLLSVSSLAVAAETTLVSFNCKVYVDGKPVEGANFVVYLKKDPSVFLNDLTDKKGDACILWNATAPQLKETYGYEVIHGDNYVKKQGKLGKNNYAMHLNVNFKSDGTAEVMDKFIGTAEACKTTFTLEPFKKDVALDLYRTDVTPEAKILDKCPYVLPVTVDLERPSKWRLEVYRKGALEDSQNFKLKADDAGKNVRIKLKQ